MSLCVPDIHLKSHPKHLSSQERKQATVSAVIELAGRQNPVEITTTTIAHHMGLTQGALFRHFPTKDALLQSVMMWVSKALLLRIDNAVAQKEACPLEALKTMFSAHIDFVCRYPGIPRLLFGELQRSEKSKTKQIVVQLLHHYRERLLKHLEEGKKKKKFAAFLDTQAAAIAFIGMIQGLIIRSLLTGNVDQIRQDAPGVFDIYIRGIGGKR